MLFTREFKEAIRAGRVTRTYRRWRRPQAKVGGRYDLHPEGSIEVSAMRSLQAGRISAAAARKAGFTSVPALLAQLKVRPEDDVWQIDFSYLGTGKEKSTDTRALADADLAVVLEKLAAMDRRAGASWTGQLLALISGNPGVRAADLAPRLGLETARFKTQVRKLKALGLTRSLETGYRLSPRGRQVIDQMEAR